MVNGVYVKVPATTANLGPGFDAVGMALQIENEFEFEIIESPRLLIDVVGEGAQSLPRVEQNLVYRALTQTYQEAEVPVPNLRLRIRNTVPLSSGLGSSATAIVAGVVAAHELMGKPFDVQEIIDLATCLEGHPDNVVPAALGGIVAAVSGADGVVAIPIEPPEDLGCVVLVPNLEVNTKKARDILPDQVFRSDAVFNVGRASLLVAALAQGRLDMLHHAMQDRLHQPYRQSLVPAMQQVIDAGTKAGALGVTLSGSGPSFVAFTDRREGVDAAVGDAMQGILLARGIGARVYTTKPQKEGAIQRTQALADRVEI